MSLYTYTMYTTEEKFEAPDIYSDHTYGYRADVEHGFQIEVDLEDNVYIETLCGFNDFSDIEKECKTLEELKNFLQEHLDEVDNKCHKECVEELIECITYQLQKEVA